MYRAFILLCAFNTLARGAKVHEEMTASEFQSTFGTNDEVPEYEVVPVAHAHHRKSREHHIVQITGFEQSMTLYLEPTDGYLAGVKTPVYKARSNSSDKSGVHFDHVPDAITANHNFFQDTLNLASLMIRQGTDGNMVMNGVVNTFAIKPIPERLLGQFSRNKRSVQDNVTDDQHDFKDTHHHIMFKLPNTTNARNDVANLTSPTNLENASSTEHVVPSIIYPQVLVVVESSLFNIFKQNVEETVSYILSFWNAVDLRYRVFRDPNVRINVAGIILAEDDSVTPYIKEHHVNVTGHEANKIDVDKALRRKTQFLYPETNYDMNNNILKIQRLGLNFDMIMTMTSFDMCQFPPSCFDSGNYVCSTSKQSINNLCITLGLAYYTGACAYNATTAEMESVGIIEDKGGFGGIIPAAHEVGHLLGASHHPKNEHQCPTADGYLMSQKLIVTGKSFIWSNCSVNSIKIFLNRESRAQCLFDKPDTGSQVLRLLPGAIITRDEQCNRIVGTPACTRKVYANNCERLFCMKNSTSNQQRERCIHAPYTAVPEGSSCGQDKHCINAKCVYKTARRVTLEIGTPAPTRKYKRGGILWDNDYLQLEEDYESY